MSVFYAAKEMQEISNSLYPDATARTFGERYEVGLEFFRVRSEPPLRVEDVRVWEDRAVQVHETRAHAYDGLWNKHNHELRNRQGDRRRHTPPGIACPPRDPPSGGTTRTGGVTTP